MLISAFRLEAYSTRASSTCTVRIPCTKAKHSLRNSNTYELYNGFSGFEVFFFFFKFRLHKYTIVPFMRQVLTRAYSTQTVH